MKSEGKKPNDLGIEYEVPERLSVGEIKDIIATACEGGINYFSILWNEGEEWDAAEQRLIESGEMDDTLYCDVFWEVLRSGGKVKFTDCEVDNPGPDDTWYLDLEKFKNGCIMYAKKRGSVVKALADGSFDAIEADCLFQYALFGEIVYG